MNEAETKSSMENGDPTTRTTSSILREVASLKELFETRLDAMDAAVILLQSIANRSPSINEVFLQHEAKFEKGQMAGGLHREIIETRLDGMDKAIRLLQDTADKFPCRIDEKILSLEKVHEEKFNSIDKQFKERDVRTQQAAEAQTTAVNAALQAQKESAQKQAEAFGEATQKAETQFTKQIDQIAELNRTENKGLVIQINELNNRFNRGEGVGVGAAANKTDNRLLIGVLIAVVGMIIGIVGLVIKLN